MRVPTNGALGGARDIQQLSGSVSAGKSKEFQSKVSSMGMPSLSKVSQKIRQSLGRSQEAQSAEKSRNGSSVSIDGPSGLRMTGTGDIRDHPVMRAFVNDPGPKILLIPEGHRSHEAMDARQCVSQEGGGHIHSFSEGETGNSVLGGVRGIEKRGDFETAPLLDEYLLCQQLKASDPHYEFVETDLDTPEKLYAALRSQGTSEKDIKAVKKQFINAKSPEQAKRAVYYFQNERRDLRLAGAILNECKSMAKNPDKKVGVGFFGATHPVDTHDSEGDQRTSNDRIPQILQRKGKQGDHCVNVKGVNVYVYPKVMEGSETDPHIRGFLGLQDT